MVSKTGKEKRRGAKEEQDSVKNHVRTMLQKLIKLKRSRRTSASQNSVKNSTERD